MPGSLREGLDFSHSPGSTHENDPGEPAKAHGVAGVLCSSPSGSTPRSQRIFAPCERACFAAKVSTCAYKTAETNPGSSSSSLASFGESLTCF